MRLNPTYYSDAAGTVPVTLSAVPAGTVVYMRVWAGAPPVPTLVVSKSP